MSMGMGNVETCCVRYAATVDSVPLHGTLTFPPRQSRLEMDSCPICYETFSTVLDTVARKLPCGDVVCTQCLRDCFEQDSDGRSPEEPVSETDCTKSSYIASSQ